MQTGVSPLYYPEEQPTIEYELHPDNSYYLVKLHAVQSYFKAGWLTRPGFLTLSSSVQSSFRPDQATQSLYQVTSLRKNTPHQLGYRPNLTDWLPARNTDTLRLTLNYTVTQDTPFKDLVDNMQEVGLVAKLSLVRPDWAVAVKVSEISGRLLSYLLQEGKTHNVFSLTVDLNLQELKTGYYVVFGSPQESRWPSEVSINDQGQLDGEHYLFDRLCYAVIKVLALPRRGEEVARGEPWWELLQTGKEQVLDSFPFIDDKERQQIIIDWRSTLTKVRDLARKEHGCLVVEIREMIQAAQVEVEQKLFPVSPQADQELPQEWQNLLEVSTEGQLQDSVRDYQDALKVSERLVEHYETMEN
jgi:hypothetical protein